MRILYFHQHFSTPEGSTGTRSYEMARRLVDAGHRVTMVCGSYHGGKSGLSGEFVNGERRGTVDGIEVVELALPYSNYDGFLKRGMTFLLFALRSVRLALAEKTDLIFATSTPLTAGIPGVLARLVKGRRFVFEVRDLWPELPREMGVITNPMVLKAMDLLELVSYRTAAGCIGLSPGIVDGITRRRVPASRVEMVPNGCDLDTFTPEGEKWRPVEVPQERFLAVFSGAHGIANGLDAVLDAAAELKRRDRDDIVILLVGDGKLKPALQARAQKERLDNCVFLDPLPKRRLTALLRSADAGLMILANVPAFYYGTSPNKFFDYIATGLPVVNNYPGWLAGLIMENGCGRAVPPGDPKALADALAELADDAKGAKEMGLRARRLAEKEFSRDMLADRFISFLERCGR